MSCAPDSIRVIDFGRYLAGLLAALLLADQGAEVIRVDPPCGMREPSAIPLWTTLITSRAVTPVDSRRGPRARQRGPASSRSNSRAEGCSGRSAANAPSRDPARERSPE